MKYGDFTSLVQLGVGLHVGTALLQIYGELGVRPLARAIERTRSLFAAPENERPPKTIEEALESLEGRFEVFKIRLFHEYRKYVIINSCVAGVLAFILVLLAYNADSVISDSVEWQTVLMCGAALLPGPSTLLVLWIDANQQVKPMQQSARELEMKAMRSIAASGASSHQA